MTLYTVHLPHEASSTGAGKAELLRAELVKDGFHWWAFLLPLVWLLFNRIWWGLLGYVALVVVLALAGRGLSVPPAPLMVFELLVGLFLGLVAGDLKAWQLGRRGYTLVDVVSGGSHEEAERRFFDRAVVRSDAPPASRPASPALRPGSGAVQPVIGLFPEAGGSR